MDKIVIERGIAMPFYPIRPRPLKEIRNKGNIEDFYWQVLRTHDWIVQPKLEGDRACIGVLDGKVYIQNRHGGWYTKQVKNLADFKKLPNRTVMDGEVFKGNFYPFDCLASDGHNFQMATVAEREVLALKLVQFLKHEWKFGRPNKRWVAAMRNNLPDYGGVVLKRQASPYIIQGAANDSSLDWVKRVWG